MLQIKKIIQKAENTAKEAGDSANYERPKTHLQIEIRKNTHATEWTKLLSSLLASLRVGQ
jgi:hypothetical protein